MVSKSIKGTFNLAEYRFAVEVVKNFPQIQKEMNALYKSLHKHHGFLAVANVLNAINDSNEMLTKQFSYYKIVVDKKGKT